METTSMLRFNSAAIAACSVVASTELRISRPEPVSRATYRNDAIFGELNNQGHALWQGQRLFQIVPRRGRQYLRILPDRNRGNLVSTPRFFSGEKSRRFSGTIA